MKAYKSLNNQIFSQGEYALVPIRMQDRYDIMRWRNEQIYHLRQSRPLTIDDQDKYFNNVVSLLFEKEQPEQVLFSFLKGGKCIGYGGLVHISWLDQNAEVSFIMDTKLEKDHFVQLWVIYLNLLKKAAFQELNLHKIYTYAFDIRPRLYEALKMAGFREEARLKGHCRIGAQFRDVLIHSYLNDTLPISLRAVQADDIKLLFEWANDPVVRQNALNEDAISWEEHQKWFSKKLKSKDSKLFIAMANHEAVGQLRIDKSSQNEHVWEISYAVAKNHRGKGFGKEIIRTLIATYSDTPFYAVVKSKNIASLKIFDSLGFKRITDDTSSNPALIAFTFNHA